MTHQQHPTREPQSRYCLLQVRLVRPDISNEQRHAVPPNAVLQQVRQLALSIRQTVPVLPVKGHHQLLQVRQTLVNEAGLVRATSNRTDPSVCVFFVRSLPAKSMMLILLIKIFSELSTLLRISSTIVKIPWDRDDRLFSLCSLMVLLVWPSNIRSSASSSDWHFGYFYFPVKVSHEIVSVSNDSESFGIL